jgi:hypothetical protein
MDETGQKNVVGDRLLRLGFVLLLYSPLLVAAYFAWPDGILDIPFAALTLKALGRALVTVLCIVTVVANVISVWND